MKRTGWAKGGNPKELMKNSVLFVYSYSRQRSGVGRRWGSIKVQRKESEQTLCRQAHCETEFDSDTWQHNSEMEELGRSPQVSSGEECNKGS